MNGIYRTTTVNEHSRTYSFHITHDSEQLLVEEEAPGYRLQLCSQEWRKLLERSFPKRLLLLHSQWYWAEHRVVLLRSPSAFQSRVKFVMTFGGDGTAKCYEVPRHDEGLRYHVLIQRLHLYPVFVKADASLVKVFTKLEHEYFIHAMEHPDPSHSLEIFLPRFGLRFVETSDGSLASLAHSGFVLSECQQLSSGQMPTFHQYLILQKGSSRRMLLPTGQVVLEDPGTQGSLVQIKTPSGVDASIAFSVIDEHPRLKLFTPDSVETRLQLATIYAASSNRILWDDLGMTGDEAALQMLRGCTPSRPFSTSANEYLQSIAREFSYRTPALMLLVALLLRKSQELAFLSGLSEEANNTEGNTIDISDALDEYRNGAMHATIGHPARQRLTRSEETDLLGSSDASDAIHSPTYVVYDGSTSEDRVGSCTHQGNEISRLEVRTIEQKLLSFCHSKRDTFDPDQHSCEGIEKAEGCSGCIPPFPLSTRGSNEMSRRMIGELRHSWDAFHRHSSSNVTPPVNALPDEEMKEMRDQVIKEREDLWQYLEQTLLTARSSTRGQLLFCVDFQPRLTLVDVMQIVVDPNALLNYAPYLNWHCRGKVKAACIKILELCVLEDKLERLLLGLSGNRLIEELQTRRVWSAAEHPFWLVFEVEGRLQIRPEQYVIAKHLIDNPGSICQLNMGRGKTRVILPMLFLHYSFRARAGFEVAPLTRAHFLSPLLSETREFMWRVLTSSVLTLPFIELPFNRSYNVGLTELRIMGHVLSEGKRNGAVLMVAPEHRLSLELKRVEIRHFQGNADDEVVHMLDDVLDSTQYVDVFDESDALLDHGYHLVYAAGNSEALDGGADRWLCAEAVLRVLISKSSVRVQKTLQLYRAVWSVQPEYRARPGAESGGGIFDGFRLSSSTLSSTDEDLGTEKAAHSALRVAIVEDLMSQAPFDVQWLSVLASRDEGERQTLIRLLTDPSVDIDQMIATLPTSILHVRHQVLALRGLLAFGVLEGCLQKRYRVEYGHPPPNSRPKAIAIPYKAADLASERSEFSHPDVGIVLTLLSFYHSGLSQTQMRRAFEALLSLDESESERYYVEWFDSVKASIKTTHVREMLARLQHISLDNAHQFVVIWSTFRYAIEVINFFLNFCVFPNDTRQFPQRLSRSAWDLVRGQTNVGFSGTNDTHHLLPLAVRQCEPDDPALTGTNGKMVQLLLDATIGYEPLADEDDTESMPRACWQSQLLLALSKRCHALIDTGALLAGVSNYEAAQFLLEQGDFPSQGVTYYDTRPEYDTWVVLEKARNLVHRHKDSSLRESATFVIFDEARSRGSDMKLQPQAVALLTLGPKITKDKLMQGAGRMRQLGHNQQTLRLTSTLDVYKSIMQPQHDDFAEPGAEPAQQDIVSVLNWVVDNTERQCTLGLLEWAESGIQYCAKRDNVDHEVQADDWTLEGQYAAAQTEQLIEEVIETKLSRRDELQDDEARSDLERIRDYGITFGGHDWVSVTGFGEECERELQIEEEQQQEREYVRRTVLPCSARAWDWRSLFSASSAAELQIGVSVFSVDHAARTWLFPPELGMIAWGETKMYATQDFWTTVWGSSSDLTGFLRQVNAMIVFADGSVLLLSEFEEEAVLKMLMATPMDHNWRTASQRQEVLTGFALVHLPFVVGRLKHDDGMLSPSDTLITEIPLALGWDGRHLLPPRTLKLPFLAIVACCLLNGDTELFMASHPADAEEALRVLLDPLSHREETLQVFVSARGFTTRWKRSALHTLSKRMDLEESTMD